LSIPCNDSVPRIDTVLPVEGTTFTLSCPPGLVLIGPNLTTCTKTGEWEPDPNRLVCTGKSKIVKHLKLFHDNYNIVVACEYPLQNLSLSGLGSLNVQDYSDPAVVGTMISFNCSRPEEVLIGPNTVTCMDDGQWEPEPQISCKGN
jgi:hypothetical protein